MGSANVKILAGDIGGTKTILQVAECVNGSIQPLFEQRYESQKFDTFERLLIQFYTEFKIDQKEIESACVGVAGPVTQVGSRFTSKVTNLPWKLDSDELSQQFCNGLFSLINDFQAIGYGVELLNDDDLVILQNGKADYKATKAVIGAGTGLGQAYLVWNELHDNYKVMPSEAGHSSFAPTTRRERQLLDYLAAKKEFVSLEQVVSGPGITNIYHFLSQEKDATPGEILLSASNSVDMTPTIVRQALNGQNSLAVEALDIFLNAYGAAAGNLALTVAATGGVYVAGGIASKIVDKMQSGQFVSAFNAKSKMKSWLESFPVYLVTNEKIGLLGAANFGLKSYLAEGS